MTYSLFEFVKERFDELIQDQPEETERAPTDDEIINDVSEIQVMFYYKADDCTVRS